MANLDQIQLPDGSQYNLADNVSGYATETYVDQAIAGVDKTAVGLGNVDNTSDLNKPVSSAQQTALNAKANNTVIAPVEASTTASRRYEIGEQFILNGILYTATAIIANGGTITVNTNCVASDSITTQIANTNTAVGKCEVLVVDIASFSSLPQTASDANIESDMVCVNSVLSNPSAQTGDWTVTTSAGSVSVSGTISGSTTLTLYLMKSR